MFTIRYDPQDNILHLALRGFWTMDTVRAFDGEVRAARKEITRTDKSFDVITNSPDFPVQSREVSAASANLQHAGRSMGERRTAVVVVSTFNKLQVERAFSDPDVAVFLNEKEARDWLKAGRA